MDYSISWAYIISRMESVFGISPDNEDRFALGKIQRKIDFIWEEYFDILSKGREHDG